jgi:signal transduction histidine kinase
VADQSIERLARLTIRLFDVARARAGTLEVRPTPCDLAAVVRQQVEMLQLATPARSLRLASAEGPVPVVADADRVGEVLANYVSNALKYSTDDQPVEVRLEVSGGRAVVAVRDNGPGLKPEEQGLVWEAFHRAPGVTVQSEAVGAGSLGLGLHVCKRIIEAHPGGQVGVVSTVGKGARFWFALPVARTQP